MIRYLLLSAACLVGWLLSEMAIGQEPPIHYFHSAMLPPGTVAAGQLRFPALQGYFQPVQVLAPEGSRVSLLVDGHFEEGSANRVLAGMQVGMVYPLKVTHIPFHEGAELYPTVEILSRLYPPPGQAIHFPVPIELTQSELELALSGRFVTRVIYLEDPATALPVADSPDHQRYYDVEPDGDPLREADRLGRPMAILRMGSRVPELGSEEAGTWLSPPVQLYLDPPAADEGDYVPTSAIERAPYNIPRAPLPDTTARPRSTTRRVR